VDYFRQAIGRNPAAQEVRLSLAYTYLGKTDDAGRELAQIRNSGAKLSVDYLERHIPLKDPALRKHLIDGLIKAGLTMEPPG
jgi:hypothetical protein